MEIELYKVLYQNLVNYASVAGIDEVSLQKYFIPEGDTSSKSILFRLCSSLQNSSMVRNSIKFNDKNHPHNRKVIEKIMYDFDTKEAVAHYPDWESIYDAIRSEGIVDNGIGKKRETNWQKYCKGLFDGLQYLAKENGEFKIKQLTAVDLLTKNEISSIRAISRRIHGLGFALTCDWLKECGCVWLAKPDVHINGVIMHMKNATTLKDEDVLNYMFTWAENVKISGIDTYVTTYKLDKIIWLLCTGEFYLDDKRTGREAIYREIDSLK